MALQHPATAAKRPVHHVPDAATAMREDKA